MIRLSIAVLVVAYLLENPQLFARLGLYLESAPVKNRQWYSHLLILVLKHGYSVVSNVYQLVHQTAPQTLDDRIAGIVWNGHQAAELRELQQWVTKNLNTQVNWETNQHELLEMHRLLIASAVRPSSKVGNGGVDWVQLGFQGADPCTDFRGSGYLGFSHYYHFCTKYPGAAELVIESGSGSGVDGKSLAPWYPLALISIRISLNLGQLLETQPLFIVRLLNGENLTVRNLDAALQEAHIRLLVQFHGVWKAAVATKKVKSVLDVDSILNDFDSTLPTSIWAGI